MYAALSLTLYNDKVMAWAVDRTGYTSDRPLLFFLLSMIWLISELFLHGRIQAVCQWWNKSLFPGGLNT